MRSIRFFVRNLRNDRGSSILELALVLPTVMLIMLAAIDFSRAYFLAVEVAGSAHAGAEYGFQNPTDTSGITAAATSDAPDVPSLSVSTPTHGCECSDGTGSSANCTTKPTCSTNVVYWVKVTSSTTYRPIFPWPGLPSTISLSNTAVMRSGS